MGDFTSFLSADFWGNYSPIRVHVCVTIACVAKCHFVPSPLLSPLLSLLLSLLLSPLSGCNRHPSTEAATDPTGAVEGCKGALQPAGEPASDHGPPRQHRGRPVQSLPAAAQRCHTSLPHQGHVQQG